MEIYFYSSGLGIYEVIIFSFFNSNPSISGNIEFRLFSSVSAVCIRVFLEMTFSPDVDNFWKL